MMEIVIPLGPITKKNHGRIVQKTTKTGKKIPILLPSEQYVKYEKECAKYITKPLSPISNPVNVKVLYYMPTKRKVDLVNLLEATDDILVHYGIIEDDNYSIVYSHDGSRVYYDKENPRCHIFIDRIDNNEI